MTNHLPNICPFAPCIKEFYKKKTVTLEDTHLIWLTQTAEAS